LAGEKKSAEAFDTALKRELCAAPPSNLADCIAPEVLAACYDRTLSRSERSAVEAHLVSCARCQSMMASIARADDSDRAFVPERSRSVFRITRLLAPVAMLGVVIAIAVSVRMREHPTPEVVALAVPRPEIAGQPQVMSNAPAAPSMPQMQNSEGGLREDKAQVSIPPRSIEPASPAENAPARAMAMPGAAGGGAGTRMLMAKASPHLNQMSSPDGSVQWQFGNGGAILRSTNSSGWLATRSGVTTDLLAAAAPSNDVCWMVGKSATIVRTLDSGAHWQIVAPPSHENFTAIAATDSNNATVITANGQRFTTRDGGVTWSSP
jgi:hypothetical protein